MTIQTTNPATGEILESYETLGVSAATAFIEAASTAQEAWGHHAVLAERATLMRNLAKILRSRKEEYAKLIATEMGKPISQGQAEIEKCARGCEHYADNAASYLSPRKVKTDFKKSLVTYQPLGVIFAIMPWNFPFWQAIRFTAPALMAGNAVIHKPAPNTSACGLALEKVFAEAGFPENIFKTVLVDNEVAASIIKHPNISAVTLTGSGRAGAEVGAEAARALKKVVLELGGSDPYIILEDADLQLAAEATVASRMNNAGQTCIAAKRIIAVNEIREEFQQLVVEKLAEFVMGDPQLDTTNFGPLAREDLRETVHRQVVESVEQGASLLLGGQPPDSNGFYYPATILTDVKPGMAAYDEEIFGPVLSFIDAKDEEDAIRIANDTAYGLSAAVFTRDLARGQRIATESIKVGTCFVNGVVGSDPRLPFGGIKASGYGRELSEEGIREFTNIKTVVVK